MQNLTQPELQTYLEEQVVLPSIQAQVESLVKNKARWQKVSTITETLSQVCTAIATVLSFSSGIYQYQVLSFLSGIINIMSLLLILFSNYSNKKNRECVNELEKIPVIRLLRLPNNN